MGEKYNPSNLLFKGQKFIELKKQDDKKVNHNQKKLLLKE